MLAQYIKFFANGGILGVVAWALQLTLYNAIGGGTSTAYGVATALTYVPLIVVNFLVQRRWIFNRPGFFGRFVLANLAIMTLVSLLAPLCRNLLDCLAGSPWGDRGGFIVAAVLGSVPSFILKRTWVFGLRF